MTGARRSNAHPRARVCWLPVRRASCRPGPMTVRVHMTVACAHATVLVPRPMVAPVSCNQCIKEAVDTGATRDRPIDFERVLQACGLLLV